MSVAATLQAIRDVIQRDPGGRGLARVPGDNLLTACPDDFAAACRSIAGTPAPVLGVVTGFYIPDAEPPAGETDGPLGALFLARALAPLGIAVQLVTDPFAESALRAGLQACGLSGQVELITFLARNPTDAWTSTRPTHLVALERVGPGHTAESLKAQPGSSAEHLRQFLSEVPAERHGRCHSARGRDITDIMQPAHELFDGRVATIGVGDGGNEIGMGKVPWDVIRRNIPNGGLVACRVPTDHLVVAGVSNWGAYALAAGVALLRGRRLDSVLFDINRERDLLQVMVEEGPLVDGMTRRPAATVDGLSFEEYIEPLRRINDLLGG
jgi:hypothetical protein